MWIRFAILLSLVSPDPGVTVFAQSGAGTLRLDVRTEAGARVPDARIMIAGLEALSDGMGRASLDVPRGTHKLSISANGFQEFSTTVTLDSGETVLLEVILTARSVIEQEIVVTAARTDRRLEDQPVRVEVVDREEIEEKALMTPGSIAMLLAETTGLRVQTTAPSLGAANVRIQGLRGRYSQLLSDGLPLYGLQGDSLSLLQVPPLDLAQVEILKGAASALYGPSALGGVINLVSQRPLVRGGQLLLNQSTQQATDVSFWVTEPPRGSLAFTVLGGLHAQARRDLDADGWADLPRYARGVLRPRLFWDGGRGRTMFATVGLMAEDRRGGTRQGATAPDGKEFPQDLDTRRFDTGAVVRLPLSSDLLLTLRGSMAHRASRRLFGSARERGGHTTWFGEAVVMGQARRHTWLLGVALHQDGYDSRELPAFDYLFTTPSVFAQDEVQLGSMTTLGISARLDHHSRYGTFASPRLSVLFKPVPGWATRLSVGTGYFAPTPFTEETEETGLAGLQPPADLAAERARSGSLDTSWSRGPLEVVATIFGSHVRDLLQRRSGNASRVELFNAERPLRTWGTELLLRIRREGFLLLATHGLTHSTEPDPSGSGRREVPLTPRHSASFNAIWEGEDWGRVGVELYYTGRQPLEENPYRIRSRRYVLMGLLAERRFGHLRVFVNLENLGNVRQTRYDPLVRRARAADGRWTVDAWAPLEGFVVNGGIRFVF